ncbi:MAG: acyltransferase family protein [Oscillospiraceae bacterium]|nr:acyltransferase family protein [Oscillospiraceae bacterium]
MKINKPLAQLLSALWILVFHLWITLTGSVAERYLLTIGYVGVDIFFLLSAYSLADKELSWWPFLKGRLITVYGKYITFIVLALLVNHWSILRAAKAASFVDFFTNGGGSFLWFIPAILILYALYPLFLRWKLPQKGLVVLAGWFILCFACEKLTGYNKIFIFANRIPVFLAGWALKKYRAPKWLPLLCLPIGLVGMYLWGFTAKLNVPFKDFFFLFGGLGAIGISFLTGYIKTGKLVKFLAGGTLELYGLQMVIGPKVVMAIYRLTGSKWVTNLLMILLFTLGSALLAFGYRKLAEAYHKKKTA